MSFNPIPYDLVAGLTHWGIVVGIFLLITLLTALATSLAVFGTRGPAYVVDQFLEGLSDLMGTSSRRLGALATLTIKESVRRKVLYVLVVFAILFLFAGWFLNAGTVDPRLRVKVDGSFGLRSISWLILPVALLLACWGLPDDIKARSLHTVVTKPVRRHEVVLGRVAGYCAVGALALVVMGVVGYIWILRQVPPEAQSELIARVPIMGELTFLDREGKPGDKGINTGDEWDFRSFVEGNTKARAIWDFTGLSAYKLSDPLRMESNFEVFRTYKGDIETGIACQFTFINEAKGIRARMASPLFTVRENRGNDHEIPRKLTDESGKPVDLFDDVIDGGNLRVEVRCLTSQQFVGVARPDLIIRLPDRSFAESYSKGILGIGLMMIMIVTLGVSASCFVKGPVAMVLTGFVLLVGRVARPFLETITDSMYKSGGVLESIYRIVTHKNPFVELDDTLPNKIMQGIDQVGLRTLWSIKYLFPDFSYFDMAKYVADGYDVNWSSAILPSLATTIGYTVPWLIVGYYSLKLRELETK